MIVTKGYKKKLRKINIKCISLKKNMTKTKIRSFYLSRLLSIPFIYTSNVKSLTIKTINLK